MFEHLYLDCLNLVKGGSRKQKIEYFFSSLFERVL